jgi:NADH-quinone oxidoreductase subunit F
MLEILERICAGDGKQGDIELLEELGEGIKAGAMCALGQTAPNPVLTTIKYFRNEYEEHIGSGKKRKKCSAKQCRELLTYSVNKEKCINCVLCRKACPADAISDIPKRLPKIDTEKCTKCGQCAVVCRLGAIRVS